uniref:Nitrogen regulatory protein PII n=1 Tax=Cyanidium sp. THAL103 TaxID=3027999 RepID=A0A9Y1I403_9RHOD|nr:nitrogen regulatory protein PII [Cyanidium sp. THAL103]
MFTKIEAIIRPFKLKELKKKLTDNGIPGMTITNVMGFGKQDNDTERYKGSEYNCEFIEKVKIEIIANNQDLEKLINLIIESCWTGEIGDGKIFISSISNIIRIRNKDQDHNAL